MQKNLSIILARTNRSICYFNELKRNKIFIDNIIFYSKKKCDFYNKIKLYKFKKKLTFVPTNDVNSIVIEKKVLKINSNYILFSGYNAQILNNENILKKKIIHFHPGKLPFFRGSTPIYYSILKTNKIHVTAFLLTKKIDDGKILFIKKFKKPKHLISIEKDYDHFIRAKTLINFLKLKKIRSFKKSYKKKNKPFYVAHPLIRSLVLNPKILKKKFGYLKKI